MEKDYLKEYEEKRNKEAEKAKADLKEIGKLLRPLKITRIEATYDGYGDSGSFEGVTFLTKKKEYQGVLPAKTFKSAYYSHEVDLKEKLEEIFCLFLPDGWEINDGSNGLVIVDLIMNTIKVEHNQRYMETNYSEEEFKL